MIPSLATPRLILRPLELADAAVIQALFPRWEIVQHLASHIPWPYPTDGALTFLRDIALPAMRDGGEWHWSICPSSTPATFLGVVSLTDNDHDNRGCWLDPAWQGRGLATEAIEAVTEFWFDTLGRSVLRVPKASANLRHDAYLSVRGCVSLSRPNATMSHAGWLRTSGRSHGTSGGRGGRALTARPKAKNPAEFAPTTGRLGRMTEPDRLSLRSKLLEATNAERAKNRYRKISKAEWDDIFDPCRWREPVFAWLLANWEQVFKARTRLELSARLKWKDIARIAELDGVKGSRGEPPNANSVRRVWDRVVSYLERQAERDMRMTRARQKARERSTPSAK